MDKNPNKLLIALLVMAMMLLATVVIMFVVDIVRTFGFFGTIGLIITIYVIGDAIARKHREEA